MKVVPLPSRWATFLLLLAAGMLLACLLALALPHSTAQAAALTGNCSLVVPANPLSAQGLANPYQLVATDQAQACHEANTTQAAFVQAAVLNPASGQIAIYNPLVIDQGTQPAVAPVVPMLPPGAIVGIWFGFNGTTLTLQDNQGSLQAGHCINGINTSLFGQFAYCNAEAFFQAANQAIMAGKLLPAALGQARDGQTCPTVRDFSVVDQDQSDNVTTSYLLTASGQTAQANALNATALANAQTLTNGSDNALLDTFIDPALGCTPWLAPDLANPGQMASGLPLDELQAALYQEAPVALVPAFDPMVLTNGEPDLAKLNAYRAGVDQAARTQFPQISNYCRRLHDLAPPRLQRDAPLTSAAPSPDPAAASSLFTFLAQRFVATYGAAAPGLNCQQADGQADPIAVQTDANGIATAVTINGMPMTTSGQGSNLPTPTPAPQPPGTMIPPSLACVINGTTLPNCQGNVIINGQTCMLAQQPLQAGQRQIILTCPPPTKQ